MVSSESQHPSRESDQRGSSSSSSGPPDTNLAIAKGSTLEMLVTTPQGFEALPSNQFFNTIIGMAKISTAPLKRAGSYSKEKDLLFLLFQGYSCCVLSFRDELAYTVAHGNISEAAGTKLEGPPTILVDPHSQFVALYLYENTLKIMAI